ncbi:hypothetical protein, partial [Pseudomonas viridiflava]|uniref:hypothetical protein n=1 Tax=Pseudomonas viridiflava TaxID=33069 RepID=UPI00197E3F35
AYSEPLVSFLLERCSKVDAGARFVDRLLDTCLIPLITNRLIEAMSDGQVVQRVYATLDAAGLVICEFD